MTDLCARPSGRYHGSCRVADSIQLGINIAGNS